MKWNGILLEDLDNIQLTEALEALKLKAEITRLTMISMLKKIPLGGGAARQVCQEEIKDFTTAPWWEFVNDIYHDLSAQARARGLPFISQEPPKVNEGLIDLNMRGPLESSIVGALRDCIKTHGPIDHLNANSAAKRVIGVIKSHNKRVKSRYDLPSKN